MIGPQGTCLFPEGRPGALSNGRRYPVQPCGSDTLYERHGCRGDECRSKHGAKVAAYRVRRREREDK